MRKQNSGFLPQRDLTRLSGAHAVLAQRRRSWPWWLLGSCLVWITLLWFLPAEVMAWMLPAMSNQRLHLAEASGSFWQGSGRLLIANGQEAAGTSGTVSAQMAEVQADTSGNAHYVAAQIARALPGQLRWQLGLQSWRMLRLTLNLDCCMAAPAQVLIGWRGAGFEVIVQAPNLRLPLALLEGLGTPWDTLRFRGDVIIAIPNLAWQPGHASAPLQGQARATIEHMYTSLTTVRPLGNYQLRYSPEHGLPTIRLSSTQDSAMQMQGQLTLAAGRLRADLTAGASSGYENQLSGLLQILGRRDGPVTRIRF